MSKKRREPDLVVAPLYCSLCMFLSAFPIYQAYSIINGQAVCLDHYNYVLGGDHARALADAQRDLAARYTPTESKD